MTSEERLKIADEVWYAINAVEINGGPWKPVTKHFVFAPIMQALYELSKNSRPSEQNRV